MDHCSIANLQELQELERHILRELIRICEKHNIRYYLIEGSLLGAVRHQGMIPWDDDIDVGMFREDYERFMRIAPQELEAVYELRSHRIQEDHIDCMAKIVNRDRYVQSFRKEEAVVTNVWIDVFVIDGMPKGALAQKLHKFRLLAVKLMLMWSDIQRYATDRKRPFYEKMLILIAQKLHLSRYIDTRKWLHKLDRAMASVPVAPDGDTVIFTSEYRFRTILPFAAYGSKRKALFDGISVSIPEDAEKILTQEYGDYSSFPPETERYKHKLKLLPGNEQGEC